MNFKSISDEYIHQPYGCNSATDGIQYTFWSIGFAALLGMPSLGIAQSSVGSFSSVVTIQGPVTQTATGNQVQQDLNIGSAQKSQASTFSSVVTTGAITQTGQNGAQQIINVGGMNNSKVTNFDARVNVGRIEQVGRNGEQQQLDIGSVSNSTVSGTAITRVEVGKGVKQTGNGEIVLGAVKNSNVNQFESNLNVRGKIEGNNIRMGSVVNQERYNNTGNYVGKENPIISIESSQNFPSAKFNMPLQVSDERIFSNEKSNDYQKSSIDRVFSKNNAKKEVGPFKPDLVKSDIGINAELKAYLIDTNAVKAYSENGAVVGCAGKIDGNFVMGKCGASGLSGWAIEFKPLNLDGIEFFSKYIYEKKIGFDIEAGVASLGKGVGAVIPIKLGGVKLQIGARVEPWKIYNLFPGANPFETMEEYKKQNDLSSEVIKKNIKNAYSDRKAVICKTDYYDALTNFLMHIGCD